MTYDVLKEKINFIMEPLKELNQKECSSCDGSGQGSHETDVMIGGVLTAVPDYCEVCDGTGFVTSEPNDGGEEGL